MSESDDFVTVYETDAQMQVAMVKMALEGADIPFVCVNEIISTVLPIDGMAVVGFQVLAQDAERAREVIADLGIA